MISREDFVFTIGYDGDHAVIDGKAKRQYGSLSTMALAEKGLLRAAFSSALHAERNNAPGAAEEMRAFIEHYNRVANTSYTRAEELSRLFGVAIEDVSKTLIL